MLLFNFLISCNQSLILWSLFHSYMKLLNYKHGDWCMYLYIQARSSLLYLNPPPHRCLCLHLQHLHVYHTVHTHASETNAITVQEGLSKTVIIQRWEEIQMLQILLYKRSLKIRFLQLLLLDMQGQGVERILMHRSKFSYCRWTCFGKYLSWE